LTLPKFWHEPNQGEEGGWKNKFAMQWMFPLGSTMMIKLIRKRMRAENGITLVQSYIQSRGENERSREFEL
jgi:hypothetical protein